ncbi:MAG: monovalent cation/H+ antiporter complex subunit F [Rhodocyclaceae bacterium]
MTALLSIVALVLMLSLLVGLVRVWRGPGFGDRMLAAQLLGTTGIALLLVLATTLNSPALRDVALVLALLALLAVLAFVTRVWDPDPICTPPSPPEADHGATDDSKPTPCPNGSPPYPPQTAHPPRPSGGTETDRERPSR